MALPFHAKALRYWLGFVAFLRFSSVIFGYFFVDIIKERVFAKKPQEVSDLQGRTFAVWTLVTCILTLTCALDIFNKTLYKLTVASFTVALCYFLFEFFVFETVTFKEFFSPCFVAGTSILWMIASFSKIQKYEKTKIKIHSN